MSAHPLPIVSRVLGKMYRESARLDLQIARLYEQMARSDESATPDTAGEPK